MTKTMMTNNDEQDDEDDDDDADDDDEDVNKKYLWTANQIMGLSDTAKLNC